MATIPEATQWLIENDQVIHRIYQQVGACNLQYGTDAYTHLLNAIVSQQISTRAAATIFGKFAKVLNNNLDPANVLAAPDELLRSAGISRQKVGYVKNLAEHFMARPDFYEHVETFSDEEIIAELVTIKGVGLWSAQMFLIFNLNRLNVLPTDDLGLKKGIRKAYQLPDLPTKKTIEQIATQWGAYKSIATWYMWRATELKDL
jgi:DNA-3-methyladenine glycosylase II